MDAGLNAGDTYKISHEVPSFAQTSLRVIECRFERLHQTDIRLQIRLAVCKLFRQSRNLDRRKVTINDTKLGEGDLPWHLALRISGRYEDQESSNPS